MQTNKDYWRKFDTNMYHVSIAKDKYPTIRVKIYQTFFFIFTSLCIVYAEWMNLFNMSCLS